MSKFIKLQKPKFFEELEEVNNIFNDFIDTDKIANKIIENKIISDKKDVGFTMDACVFKNVVFENCEFRNCDLIDVKFEKCNLSNVSFSGGTIHRTEFVNCKLVGARFDDTGIKDVLFENILGKYINFSYSKIKGMNVVDSNLHGATFQAVRKEKLAFKDTDLRESFFNKTPLAKMDLSTCDITNIDVEIDYIRGAEVTAIQALDLTRLMGLVIK